MARGLVSFDKRHIGQGPAIIGIDEAGRGALAGPVVAAAVRVERAFYFSPLKAAFCRGVDDSKRLGSDQRAGIVQRVRDRGAAAGIKVALGMASVEEIDRFNILQATVLAMRRALGALEGYPPELGDLTAVQDGVILIDGRPLKAFPHGHKGIVGGDRQSFAIALAGIHAKEARDAAMCALCPQHPIYRFAVHKGYGTPEHVAALRAHGPSPVHRSLFIRKPLAGCEAIPDQQGSLFAE
jgi:ribonuclease HII